MREKEYVCACCGETFEHEDDWTEEDVNKEFEEKFGRAVTENDAVVCDDCYQQIMEQEENQ